MTHAVAMVLAAAAGALGAQALPATLAALVRPVRPRASSLAQRVSLSVGRVLEPLRRAGAEGIAASDRERRRLQAFAALAGFVTGFGFVDPLAGMLLGVAAALLASRALSWRRARYRRRLDAGAASAALALADALATGYSVRGALTAVGASLEGAIGVELGRVARELEVGGRTDAVLGRLRRRARSRRISLIVAAVQVQRRSGGNLAGLLRHTAGAIEEQDRLEDEARAASAQARFTSVVVLCLPLAGLLLGELASPGMVGRIAGSAVGVWLLGAALVLQLVGALVIRRLSRVVT